MLPISLQAVPSRRFPEFLNSELTLRAGQTQHWRAIMKEESRQSAIPLSSRVSTLVCGILKLHIRHDAAQRFSAYRSVLTKCVSSNSPRWTSTERRRARDQTPCRPRMAKNDLLPTLLPGERLVAKTRHRYWSLGRVQLLLLPRLLRHLPDCSVCSFSPAMEAGNPPR